MNFEEFCDEVVENISHYLPEYDIEHIATERILKNNGLEYTGVVILLRDETVAPSIYLDYFYMLYKQGRNLDDVLTMIRMEFIRARNTISNSNFTVEKDGIEDSVFLKVINYEKNREKLDNCPYIRFFDLAICFRYLVKIDDNGIASAIISNSDLKKWEITMEELYQIALPNTRRLFPPIIKSMDEVLPDVMEYLDDGADIDKLHILTNQQGVNGANGILYTDLIRDFAKERNSDVYILPSSVHELVLLCAGSEEKEHLSELIKQVNKYIVTEAEYLSDNVFIYDLEKDKITI